MRRGFRILILPLLNFPTRYFFWYGHLYFLWEPPLPQCAWVGGTDSFEESCCVLSKEKAQGRDWDCEQSRVTHNWKNALVWLITIAVLSRDCPGILLHGTLFSQSGWFLLFFRLALKPSLLVIYLLTFMHLFLLLIWPKWASHICKQRIPGKNILDIT